MLLFIQLIALPFQANSQKKLDTIFFNKNWKKTKRDSAAYYVIGKDSGRYKKTNANLIPEKHLVLNSVQTPIQNYSEGKGNYKNGKPDSIWNYYYEDGKKRCIEFYKNGELEVRTSFYRMEKSKDMRNTKTGQC